MSDARLEQWEGLHKALETEGKLPPFQSFKQLYQKDPKADYWLWLTDQTKVSRDAYRQKLFSQACVCPYPLKSATLRISTLNEFINALAAQGIALKDFWKTLPGLPLFQIGPLFGLGHFNPLHDCSSYFPQDLVVPCELSLDDYEALRAYCMEQSELFFDAEGPAYTPEMSISSLSLDAFLKQKLQNKSPSEHRRLDIVEYLIDQPTVSTEKQHQLREILRNQDSDFSISQEYDAAIDFLERRVPVLLPDLLEINEQHLLNQPLETWEGLRAIPYLLTDDTVFVLCDNAEDFAIEDAVLSYSSRQKVCRIRTTREQLLRLFQPFSKQDSNYVETQGVSLGAEVTYAFSASINDFIGYNPSSDENPNKFVQWLLFEGVNHDASDIHIERIKGQMTVRYAIDGKGVVFLRLPEYRFNPITSTIKRLAQIQLDSTKPGEGRITFSASGRPVEVRVSIIYDHARKPCIVMRLLDKNLGLKQITELGLFSDELDTLRRYYKRRSGIIIVGGATGDGKSTTLNSIMAELNQEENFCFSLEDPVEYEIDGVTQINATADDERIAKGELSFSEGIKRLLRQDPDVITVGEIRDAYTAETAVEAALTGHLVLSTVHAIDCFSVVTRLLKWKLDPLNIADTLILSISQKLIRKLCDCQVLERITEPMREHFAKYGVPIPPNKRAILKEHGCAACHFKGFRGRSALMEFLVVSSTIRELIREGASSRELHEAAVAEGFRSRYQKGLKKVLQGITSMSEIAPFCNE